MTLVKCLIDCSELGEVYNLPFSQHDSNSFLHHACNYYLHVISLDQVIASFDSATEIYDVLSTSCVAMQDQACCACCKEKYKRVGNPISWVGSSVSSRTEYHIPR